jgi:hypothetical protein
MMFVAVLIILIGDYWIHFRTTPVVYAGAPNYCTIPLSYGHCKGGMGELMLFEDSAGTVRAVHPASGMVFCLVSRK